MICKHILLMTFLNEPELIFFFFLHIVKWVQVLKYNKFNIGHLFWHIWIVIHDM